MGCHLMAHSMNAIFFPVLTFPIQTGSWTYSDRVLKCLNVRLSNYLLKILSYFLLNVNALDWVQVRVRNKLFY